MPIIATYIKQSPRCQTQNRLKNILGCWGQTHFWDHVMIPRWPVSTFSWDITPSGRSRKYLIGSWICRCRSKIFSEILTPPCRSQFFFLSDDPAGVWPEKNFWLLIPLGLGQKKNRARATVGVRLNFFPGFNSAPGILANVFVFSKISMNFGLGEEGLVLHGQLVVPVTIWKLSQLDNVSA